MRPSESPAGGRFPGAGLSQTVAIMLERTSRYLVLALMLSPAAAFAQGAAGAAVMRLSLRDAASIALAPAGNPRVQLARELITQARARAAEARAALLPNLSAAVVDQSQTRNLEAFGLRLNIPLPGFAFPVKAGPFTVFDARATASQTVLNLGSIRRYQASRAGVLQAEAESEGARDAVRAAVSRAYFAALRALAVLDAAEANVRLAEAVLRLAEDQKAAGTGTGIEITRAGVRLADQKQRRLAAQNGLTAAHLQLLRAMNLDLDVRLELADSLAFAPIPATTLEQALHEALELRSDWQAEQKRLETARLQQSASRLDRLPSVSLFADYGTIGSGIDSCFPTRTYGIAVQVPVFDGGRVDARRAQSASQYRQEAIRSEDLRAQIELEIRLALDGLQSSADQVKTAEEGLVLAENEVAQAERRYRAGASPGIELTDAQSRLERARENRISALFGYNLARIDLAVAMGTIRRITE